MKTLLIIFLIILSIALGYSFAKDTKNQETQNQSARQEEKRTILRFAIVADSSGENDLLAKALDQAKGFGVNFVVGLGDWTQVGTPEDLATVKKVFDASGLQYFVTAGDHDVWDSRNRGEDALSNFKEVFGSSNHLIERNGVKIVILDNSDIYKGLDDNTWKFLEESLNKQSKLTFLGAHKTPFHPESQHIMGAQSAGVREQGQRLLGLIREKKIDGYFSGDLHFFAQYKDDSDLKYTTVGAVASERNFQGPRFVIVTVFDDYSFKVDDIEIR